MPTFLALCIYLAAMTLYLELGQQPTSAPIGETGIHRVVRQAPASAPAEAWRTTVPLDLALPDKSLELNAPISAQQPDWLQLEADRPAVEYEAELVFDRKEGERLRGGKLHIRVPLG